MFPRRHCHVGKLPLQGVYERESEQDHRNHGVPLMEVGSAREFLQATWFKKHDSY